jgi:hypothetical protein
MPKKKYSQQCGPNLVFHEIGSEPDCAVTHKHGCGGMIAQDLGTGDLARKTELPRNMQGKVFCYECGHKVSKAVASALKTGSGQDHFYFPGKDKFELRTRIHIEGNPQRVFRYWSWEGGLSQPEGNVARLYMPKKKIKPKRLITEMFDDDGDWVLRNEKIILRLPKDQFTEQQVLDVQQVWKGPVYSRPGVTEDELHSIAAEELGIELMPMIVNEKFFGIIEGTTIALMHRPSWNKEEAAHFASQIRGLNSTAIKKTAGKIILDLKKPLGSITVDTESVADAIKEGEEDIDF